MVIKALSLLCLVGMLILPGAQADHHGTQTVILSGGAIGGAVVSTAALNWSLTDSGWEQLGSTSFAVTGSLVGTVAGLYIAGATGVLIGRPGKPYSPISRWHRWFPDGWPRAALTVGLGTTVGALMGRFGYLKGRKAARGDRHARTEVIGSSLLMVPSILLTFFIQYMITDWG